MATLILFSSKHHSTEQMAHRIAATLRQQNVEDVQCCSLDKVEAKQLAAADAVVVGAPVYQNSWDSSAMVFLESNKLELEGKKLFVFLSGGAPEPEPKIRDAVAEFRPQEQVYFRGRVEKERLNLLEKLMILVAKADYGDFRDWAAIEAWAEQLAKKL